MNMKQDRLLREFHKKLELESSYLQGFHDAYEASDNEEGVHEAVDRKWVIDRLLAVFGKSWVTRPLKNMTKALSRWRDIFNDDQRWVPRAVPYRQSWANNIDVLLDQLAAIRLVTIRRDDGLHFLYQ